MSQPSPSLAKDLSDRQLLNDLQHLVRRDHKLESELIAILGEVDARRLYLERAYPSMFHYCVSVLHFAEGVAYKRIAVARAARKHPELLRALETGDLHLTAASLIAPHLTDEDTATWLALGRHSTAQEIRQQIADRKPKPDVKTSVRRAPKPRRIARPGNGAENGATATPEARPPASRAAVPREPQTVLPIGLPPATQPEPHFQPSRPSQPSDPLTSPAAREPQQPRKARCEPLGAERYCVRFVADSEAHTQLQELRCLLRTSIPDGDVGKILTRAIGVLLEQVRKQKIASCSSPRPPRVSTRAPAAGPHGNATETSGRPERSQRNKPSRHIPAAIRRAVWKRDGGRCTFKSRGGRQCGSLQFLEFHHQVPWAQSREHTTSNIALRCRGHNQYEAELALGREPMARFRKGSAGDLKRDRGGDVADGGVVGDTDVADVAEVGHPASFRTESAGRFSVDGGVAGVEEHGENGDRTAPGDPRLQLDLIPVL